MGSKKSSRQLTDGGSTVASSTKAAYTAFSVCPLQRRAAGSTPPRRRWRCLPEAEEVDIQINEKDLRIDTFCSSGPGGQSVNTTYSAVRITHIPTGMVVSQQDEKSQIKNRAKAMKVLRARLYEMEMRKQQEAIAKSDAVRWEQGERAGKIRTYNFPQSRITDHRINFTTHRLHEVLEGDPGEILDQVISFYTAEKLKEATAVN